MNKIINSNLLSKDFYIKQKETFISFLKRVADFTPSVLVGLFILVITAKLYGRENSTIGVVSIFICGLMRQSFTASNYPLVAFRILLLGFLATIAEQNIFLIIILNFVVPFLIVFLLSDDFVPRGYFIYGFAYVIFQAYNIPIENISLRMESIAFALIIIFIFLSLNKIINKNNNNNLASKCIGIINKKLLLLCSKKCDLKRIDDLFSAIKLYTSSIYMDSLKRNSIMNNKNINDFEFVLFLEEINQLIEKEYKNIDNLTDSDFEYFSNLYKLLENIKEFLKNDITKKKEEEFNSIAKQIKNFNDNYTLSDENKNYEWLYVLRKLDNILHNIFENRADDLYIEKEFYLKFRIIKKEFNINKCHFRFALKMGIIMCITFTIRYFLPEKIAIRGYWLPILSYIMMYPFYEDVKANLKINLIGNIIGVLIFGLVFRYMPYYMIIPFIGLCFVLSLASINTLFKKIYGTMSALISSFPYMTKLLSTSSRVGFIMIALFIVWLFDNFIMKTESHKGMVDKISELIEIDTMIINQMKRVINSEDTSSYLYEILLKAYMIKNNIIIHEKNQTKYKGTPITDSLIEANRKFIVEAEQLIYLLKKYNRKEDKNNMLMFIENISFILENIAKLFKNEIDDFNSKDLKEPQITEEKKAARTYYYDSKGNKCKKADAVKVVKKGTVLQKSTIRYFSDKNDYFKSQKFIYDCKQFFLKEKLGIDWSFEMDQQNRELAEKHIGKNNPKEEYIRQNNNLKGTIKDVCKAGDYMFEYEKGKTLKRFKEDYNITSFVTSKYEENKGKVNIFVKEMQSIYKDRVKNEIRKHNDINEDINFLQETDYIYRPVQENIISAYENETQTREKPKVIDFLKNKIYHLLERIENLIHLQDFLHIERKNQIEIEENKRTHNLSIKDNNYYKKQERQKNDIDLEL